MAVRTKDRRRSTPHRRSVAVNGSKASHGRRPGRDRAKSAVSAGKVKKVRISFAPKPAVHATPGAAAFSKAMRFLNTLSDYERLRIVRYNSQNFDLERMRTLLRKLGNPQEHFKSVHIAGTKGKGSTCAMTASMLEA